MRRFALPVVLVFVGLGCVDNPAEDVVVDEAFYRCRVQPVLDRGCATLACHGDARRPFHVFTRNRLRLDEADDRLDRSLTVDELAANYDNARGFLDQPAEESWLLKKPLAPDAGGWFHLGEHLFGGGDVWLTEEDPGFQTVLEWARGATDDPACSYKGTL